ncbi:MAG: hypothetical protein MUF23_14075, partial [Pirellula sp.]|nr:hypothetical protein [Pirellula sp.]
MSNHWHFVLRPTEDGGMSNFFRWVTLSTYQTKTPDTFVCTPWHNLLACEQTGKMPIPRHRKVHRLVTLAT